MANYKCEKAIILLGKPNSGKTTTLREVANRLCQWPGAVIKNGQRCRKYLTVSGADITVVVEINGKRVLVRSCGDDEHEIIYTLDLVVKFKCDIAVFAVSMPQKDGGRKAVYSYYQTHKQEIAKSVVEVRKLRAEDASGAYLCVKATTDELMKLITSAVKKEQI